MLAHRIACLTAAATLALILAGGLVTDTGSALAVPDWPTTFGYNLFLYPWSKMVGGVLYEHMAYDEDGNPLTTTFMDYLLPTATEVPAIEYGHIETPAPTNPGGHKGMGEGGAIASPPAVVNAVADALAPLGVEIRSQPLGPGDVVRLLEGKLTRTSSMVSGR